MPFGIVSGVGRGMGVLDWGGDRRRRRGSFGGEFGGATRSSQSTLGGYSRTLLRLRSVNEMVETR